MNKDNCFVFKTWNSTDMSFRTKFFKIFSMLLDVVRRTVKNVLKNITEGKIALESQCRVVLKMLKSDLKKWVLEAAEK